MEETCTWRADADDYVRDFLNNALLDECGVSIGLVSLTRRGVAYFYEGDIMLLQHIADGKQETGDGLRGHYQVLELQPGWKIEKVNSSMKAATTKQACPTHMGYFVDHRLITGLQSRGTERIELLRVANAPSR